MVKQLKWLIVLLLLLLVLVTIRSFFDSVSTIGHFQNKQDSLVFKIDSLTKELKAQEETEKNKKNE